MPGSYLAAIFFIVAELIVGDVPVLVSEEPVASHDFGIEIHLYLCVLCDDLERTGQVLHEDPFRLSDGVDVCVMSVSLVS